VTTKKDKAGQRVVAAGAVLWRPDPQTGAPQVAVIHRPRYNDWTLPKGKLERGETEPVAAVREIFEETGQRAVLGRRLSTVNYPIPTGTKVVHYWVARALGGEFTPGSEVDRVEWLPVKAAAKQLTYPLDRKMVNRFAKKPADTETLLIVRHGAAGRKARYKGDDRKRPLDKKGRAQAASLVPLLEAFGGTSVYAADRVRCSKTVEPFATAIGVPISNETTLTEEAYAADPDAAHKRVLEIAETEGTPVICSQGKVIPFVIDWWCSRDGVKPDKSRNRKGSTWVVSHIGGEIIAADHLPSPLAKQD